MRVASFIVGLLSGVISVGSWALDVEKARKMTDSDIEAQIAKGEFAPRKARIIGGRPERNQERVCEWVEADRRAIVTRILHTSQAPVTDSRYPLLACSPNEEAYRYWQSLGASKGRLGAEYPLNTKLDANYIEKWGHDFDGRLSSLAVAAGNLNVTAVALLLGDGAAVNERSGEGVHTPLGAALYAWAWTVGVNWKWQTPGEEISERDGYGLGVHAANTTYAFGGTASEPRRRRSDVAAAIQVVRLLMEAGASLDDLTGQGYMAANTLSYRGYRIFGETYRQKFATRRELGVTLPKLLEAEAYGKEIRRHVAECQNWNENACRQLLTKADEVSPSRKLASRQIAALEKTRADWDALIAKQTCTLTMQGWAYTGAACVNGRANGHGSAVRWWTGENFQGLFLDGAFAEGKYSLHDHTPVFQGRFNSDGSYANGKLYESGQPVYEGPFSEAGKPQGNGICWVDGAPEECRHHGGQRIDSLYKQRLENQKLKKELAEQQRQKEEAAMRRAQAEAQQRRQQEAEERKEVRFQAAITAGIGAMRGDYSASAAAGMPGADVVVMQQKMNAITSSFMAEKGRSSPASRAAAVPQMASSSEPPAPSPVAESKMEDVDALAKKRLTRFRCEWATVTQPEGEEMIAEGVCHAADMAAHEIQCRPDWQSHPATLQLYQCAAQHSTGRFRQRYEEQAKAYEAYQRNNLR